MEDLYKEKMTNNTESTNATSATSATDHSDAQPDKDSTASMEPVKEGEQIRNEIGNNNLDPAEKAEHNQKESPQEEADKVKEVLENKVMVEEEKKAKEEQVLKEKEEQEKQKEEFLEEKAEINIREDQYNKLKREHEEAQGELPETKKEKVNDIHDKLGMILDGDMKIKYLDIEQKQLVAKIEQFEKQLGKEVDKEGMARE